MSANGVLVRAEGAQTPAADAVLPEAKSSDGLLCRAAVVAAWAVLEVLLLYSSGASIVAAFIYQQCGGSFSPFVLQVLFPAGFRNFQIEADGSVDLIHQNFLALTTPWFVLAIVWEWAIICFVVPHEQKPLHLPRIDDSMSLDWCQRLYNFVREHQCITDALVDTTNPLVFWLCFLVNLFTVLSCAFLFPPNVTAAMSALILLYQFWIHTQLVHPLSRCVERILNMHHARNHAPLRRNFAVVLSLLDWLGGTIEFEDSCNAASGEASHYGIIPAMHSLNPLWATSLRLRA